MATKCLIDTSTQNFKKLFDLTRNAGLIDPSVDYNSIAQQTTERWSMLLDIWQKYKRRFAGNVFLRPFARIMYNLDYAAVAKKYELLLEEIERVIIDDDEAFGAWAKTKAFYHAYRRLLYDERWMNSYLDFLDSCGTLRLFNGRNVTEPDRIRQKSYHPVDERYIRRCEEICERFKSTLEIVLRKETAMTDEQWVDSRYSCRHIEIEYDMKLDYSNAYRLIHSLYGLIDYTNTEEMDYRVSVIDIFTAPVNYNIAKVLFPENTDEVIYVLLYELWGLCEYHEEFVALRDSWIVKILYQWTDDPEHKYYRKARKALIDLTMTK